MERDGNIILRTALPDDSPGIAEIEQLCFANACERFEIKRIHHLITSPRTVVTTATQNGLAIGWAAGYAWLHGSEPWGRLYALAVHPKARGQHLGERLLHDMIQSLRSRGAGRIFLEVRTDNLAAIGLYEKAGFRNCRALQDYYEPGISANRMQLLPV